MPRRVDRRFVVLIASLGCMACLTACGRSGHNRAVRRPLLRPGNYAAAIAGFKKAIELPYDYSNEPAYLTRTSWNQRLPPESEVQAVVSGVQNTNIDITFADESEPRRVTEPTDGTSNVQVRVNGSTLYVYYILHFHYWDECRLAVYDLAARKLVADLLVAPEDIWF